MERLYNYSEQRESIEEETPSTSERKQEVDFNDVFGGPPRRISGNESVSGEESETGWCRWPVENEREKPVFGDDSGVRSRYSNKKAKDFFDDIFGGGEESQSGCSTPKIRDGAFSPALQPLASSLPPSFSLPAKLTKGVDLQTFGSPPSSRNPLDNDISASNGLGFSDSQLSRFSAQHKESRNDSKPSYRQSLLSKEFSNMSQSDEVDKGNNMKQDTPITGVSPDNTSNDNKFHFSIYKWASKGVPFRTDRTSRTKDKFKLEKSLSAKEWIVTEITTQNDSPKEWMVSDITTQNDSSKEWLVSEITTQNDSPITYNDFTFRKNKKQDASTTPTTTQNKVGPHQTVEHTVSAKAQSDSFDSRQTLIKEALGSPISNDTKAESSTHSTSEIVFFGKPEATSETQKQESKSLHSLFSQSNKKQDYDEMAINASQKNKAKSSKKLSSIFDVPKNSKKKDEKQKPVPLRDAEYNKATSKGSLSPGRSTGKGRVKGKVKDFVQIFNQETLTKPKVDSKSRLQGYAYKQKGAERANNDVDGDPVKSKKEISTIESKKEISTIETTDVSANNLSQPDDISASAIPDISFADIGDKDESFHENFTIEVLSQDEDEVSQNQEIQEIQAIDKKIQQWSKGKEGNIRSLLSTLQYVLWPNCGWKPVPLVDIIEGNAVKRSYQRALLCLHPDKLQQKGAASDQKYIAEKVFDILQEAWTQFNIVGAL